MSIRKNFRDQSNQLELPNTKLEQVLMTTKWLLNNVCCRFISYFRLNEESHCFLLNINKRNITTNSPFSYCR